MRTVRLLPTYSRSLSRAVRRVTPSLQLGGDSVPGHYAIRICIPGTPAALRCDCGNWEKGLSDALQRAVVQDDRLAEAIAVVRDRRRNSETVLIEIWALPEPAKPKRPRTRAARTTP
jgi:hypothetical protein